MSNPLALNRDPDPLGLNADPEIPLTGTRERDLSDPLYEFTGDLEALYSVLEENGGELTEEMEEAIAQAIGSFSEKALRVGEMIESFLADAEMYDARIEVFQRRIDRIRGKRDARRRAAESLKRYLRVQMERAGEPKIKGPDFTLRVQTNSTPSILRSPGITPALEAMGFLKPPAPREIDTRAVIAIWKKDPLTVEAHGFVIEQGTHLRVD
jgi:hypothetical protein